MGLDISHDCWHGPYSMFMRWREWIASQVGIPLRLMQGFVEYYPEEKDVSWSDVLCHASVGDQWKRGFMILHMLTSLAPLGEQQIRWDMMKHDPLWILLNHSDCEGKIKWWYCKRIAERLMQIYRSSKNNDVLGHGGMDCKRGAYDSMRRATLRFALGCMKAYRAREHVVFR
jgi:hypothetical protein